MRSLIFSVFLIIGLNLYSQSFSIVSLESLPMDLTASTQSRVDLNGKRCGLVKVQCVLDGIKFTGNIIGSVEHKEGEYWVYLIEGSRHLSVKHPKLLPIEVEFTSSLYDGIKSASTYRLVLSIPEATYSSVLMHNTDAVTAPISQPNDIQTVNTTISGTVTDRKSGEPLIGCTVLLKNTQNGTYCDIDGNFTLNNIKPGETLQVSYVGYKQKEITFTGKIPLNYNIALKEGHGKEKEEYFYDPNDSAEYFDLKGNKLSQRPSKRGMYIRLANGKAEKLTIK